MKTKMFKQFRNEYAGNLNHVNNNIGSIVMPESLCLDFNKYWTSKNNDYSTTATSYKEIVF